MFANLKFAFFANLATSFFCLVEAEIGPIKDAGPKGKIRVAGGGEKKPKQRIGRGSNPRLKGNKWEIKDEELKAELKDGVVLLAYQSNDPTEPTV